MLTSHIFVECLDLGVYFSALCVRFAAVPPSGGSLAQAHFVTINNPLGYRRIGIAHNSCILELRKTWLWPVFEAEHELFSATPKYIFSHLLTPTLELDRSVVNVVIANSAAVADLRATKRHTEASSETELF